MQSTYKEAYIRRALALVARRRLAFHRRRFYLTAIGVAPLLPLAVSPFPNIPLYYVAYRVYSHRCARDGAGAVIDLLQQRSDRVRQLQGLDGHGQQNSTHPSASEDSPLDQERHEDHKPQSAIKFVACDQLGDLCKTDTQCVPTCTIGSGELCHCRASGSLILAVTF